MIGKADWCRGSQRSIRGVEVGFLESEVMRVAGRRVEERSDPGCCLGSAYPVSLNVHVHMT